MRIGKPLNPKPLDPSYQQQHFGRMKNEIRNRTPLPPPKTEITRPVPSSNPQRPPPVPSPTTPVPRPTMPVPRPTMPVPPPKTSITMPTANVGNSPAGAAMKQLGTAPGMKKGGKVSASKRADGIAERGKTKGRYI